MQNQAVGKYEALIAACCSFAVLAVVFTLFNVYASKQVNKQTNKVILALHQQGLSKQLTDLGVFEEVTSSTISSPVLEKLNTDYLLFDASHDALLKGGLAPKISNSEQLNIEAGSGPKGNLLIHDLDQVWQLFRPMFSHFQAEKTTSQTNFIGLNKLIKTQGGELRRLTTELVNFYSQQKTQWTTWYEVALFLGLFLGLINLVIIIAMLRRLKSEAKLAEKALIKQKLQEREPHLEPLDDATDWSAVKDEEPVEHYNNIEGLVDDHLWPDKPNKVADSSWAKLYRLSDDIAIQRNKLVKLNLNGVDSDLSDEVSSTLCNVMVLLIRNSIMHSIELPEQRLRLNKPAYANITINLTSPKVGTYSLSYQDDGASVNFDKIRNTLIQQGKYPARQVQLMRRRDLVHCLFDKGFSTAYGRHSYSQKGMGLSLAIRLVKQIGGRLNVHLSDQQKLHFTVDFKQKPVLRSVAI